MGADKFRSDMAVPRAFSELEGVSYLGGHRFGEIINAELAATAESLRRHGRPSGLLRVPSVTPESVGALVFFFELATAVMGELLDIDAFDLEWTRASGCCSASSDGRGSRVSGSVKKMNLDNLTTAASVSARTALAKFGVFIAIALAAPTGGYLAREAWLSSAPDQGAMSSLNSVAVRLYAVPEPETPHLSVPETFKGIYVTSDAYGESRLFDKLLGLVERTEINSMVIDLNGQPRSACFRHRTPRPQALRGQASAARRLEFRRGEAARRGHLHHRQGPGVSGPTLRRSPHGTCREARRRQNSACPKWNFNEDTQAALVEAFNSGCNVSFAGNNWGGANDVCNFVESGTMSIAWNGDVSPCWPLMHTHTSFLHGKPRLSKKHVIANVKEHSLDEIWMNPDYVSYRERLHNFVFAPCTF